MTKEQVKAHTTTQHISHIGDGKWWWCGLGWYRLHPLPWLLPALKQELDNTVGNIIMTIMTINRQRMISLHVETGGARVNVGLPPTTRTEEKLRKVIRDQQKKADYFLCPRHPFKRSMSGWSMRKKVALGPEPSTR
jgi:hypothetical protein